MSSYIVATILGIVIFAVGTFLGDVLRLFYMEHRRAKCGECGKKYKQIPMVSFHCDVCLQKAKERYFNEPPDGLQDIIYPASSADFVTMAKEMWADPELVKQFKKAFGLQSERERFEEESEHERL